MVLQFSKNSIPIFLGWMMKVWCCHQAADLNGDEVDVLLDHAPPGHPDLKGPGVKQSSKRHVLNSADINLDSTPIFEESQSTTTAPSTTCDSDSNIESIISVVSREKPHSLNGVGISSPPSPITSPQRYRASQASPNQSLSELAPLSSSSLPQPGAQGIRLRYRSVTRAKSPISPSL